MYLRGVIKGSEDKIGLFKTILEKEGLKVEEEHGMLYFHEEVNPMHFNRTKSYEIFQKLKELGAEDMEITAYSVVEIYSYKYKDGETNERD